MRDECLSSVNTLSKKSLVCVVILLVIHVALLAWGSYRHSPTYDELGHLPAGMSHWQFRKFHLYSQNPPLVRMVAALPVLASSRKDCWDEISLYTDSHTAIGKTLCNRNGFRAFLFFTRARWAVIPFSVLGGLICFLWAREMYGTSSGLLALSLWTFAPNVMAHGQMVTPDCGATALGAAAGYAFWRWYKVPVYRRAFLAGVALGLAQLAKSTWIVLFLVWPVLFAVCRLGDRQRPGKTTWLPQMGQVALILFLGVYLINLGYGFHRSFERLGEFRFVSHVLAGEEYFKTAYRDLGVGNRFADSILGSVPVPLPADYVQGIDEQRSHFEMKLRSYLRGEWKVGGWWYYYLYALAVKVPLGTWMILLLAIGASFRLRAYTSSWQDEFFLLAPALVVLVVVSSQTGFNHHLRYVLPIFPFALIWMSKVARAIHSGHHQLAILIAAALTWSIGSSLWIYPHSLSYFNGLVGGPMNGHAHLLNSNIDWGQDLLYLKRWLDKHPEAQPLYLAYQDVFDEGIAGIECSEPPSEFEPGWHAIGLNQVYGHSRAHRRYREMEPVAMAGYSIHIYNVKQVEPDRTAQEPEPESRGSGTSAFRDPTRGQQDQSQS